MTNLNEVNPSDDVKEDSNYTKLAAFIQYRKEQKDNLKANTIIPNSLSKNNTNNFETNKDNEKIFKIFDIISEQLNEGHTVYVWTLQQNNQKQVLDSVNKLVSEQWANLLDENNLSTQNTNAPIIIKKISQFDPDEGKVRQAYVFWLHRHWYAEQSLTKKLMKIATRRVEGYDFETSEEAIANKLIPNKQQQLAIEKSTHNAFSIIIGGPGTGKTFTVAKLVTTLQRGYDTKRNLDPNLPPIAITLTAPTGKAAQRMQESLQKSLEDEDITLDNAKTLHRLLGIGSDGVPRYNAKNPLPDDLIIVDEASMLGLELASQLVDAIKPTGRLILLGDANQLAAVDAGAVLADLCAVDSLQPYITELIESKRFDANSLVGKFAQAIQQNLPAAKKIKSVYSLLSEIETQALNKNEGYQASLEGKIPFYPINYFSSFNTIYRQLAQPYHQFFAIMQSWYSKPVDIYAEKNRKILFDVFDSYRILCAGHLGQMGTQSINQKMSQAFTDFSKITRTKSFFYHGLPIIIQNNDYQLGLFNGDIGICLLYQGQLYACFAQKVIPIQRLSRESCDYAYAMTIHKSQGSEFTNVAICIDKSHTRLLSQALIYTAVTRSKSELSIYSPKDSFELAIVQKAVRQTGLQLQFDELNNLA